MSNINKIKKPITVHHATYLNKCADADLCTKQENMKCGFFSKDVVSVEMIEKASNVSNREVDVDFQMMGVCEALNKKMLDNRHLETKNACLDFSGSRSQVIQ